MNPSIFVQVASYRDKELIPTLRDLIENAEFPQRLRIVVCWQHGPDEEVGIFLNQGFLGWQLRPAAPFSHHEFEYRGALIELIDVPHELSQGACWARNLIQQRYQDETYTLQLDSHHRFVKHWDTRVVDMLEQLRGRSAKPVLTAYLPFYKPEQDPPFLREETPPLGMCFKSFTPGGPIFFRSYRLPNWLELTEAVPARFYSGHFTFADGSFARDVQHDPEYFFHGEEISIAVRAFTHGYDLYHPYRNLAWHEYTRSGRVKIWDDHSKAAREEGRVSQTWVERDVRSLARNRALFGMESKANDSNHSDNDPHDGPYGFGKVRTLADYELYAGISFRDRAVQPEVLAPVPPDLAVLKPNAVLDRSTLRRANDIRVVAHRKSIDVGGCSRATQCILQALSGDDAVMHEETLGIEAAREDCNGEWFDRHLVFMGDLGVKPAKFRIILRDAADATIKEFKGATD